MVTPKFTARPCIINECHCLEGIAFPTSLKTS
jgi:hypothetical protein